MAIIKTFTDFLRHFLEKRNLNTPDGRPLYEYKISEGRYNLLKTFLQGNWEESTSCYACFVLYSVEFLRSEHQETHLKWEEIFNSIKKDRFNSPQKRSEIIEKGLRYWKREVFQGQGREFLETLRFESGLPNSCLNDNNNIASLIKSAFQLLESYQLDEEELFTFIGGRVEKYPIPLVLRQNNFYQLVSKLCFKFLEFKKQYNLANQNNPTEYLQSMLPDWRTQMPFKIEGEKMISFFDSIISEISKIEKIEPQIIKIESVLVEINEEFFIKSFLSIPSGIHSYRALSLEKENFDKLPGYFNMNLECEGKISHLASFTKTSDGKVSSRLLDSYPLPVNIVGKEWSMIYTSEDLEVQTENEIANIYEIPANEPLIFIEDNEKWIFKGSAPMKIKEANCRILIMESLFTLDTPSYKKIGLSKSGLTIYEVNSDCIITEIDNQTGFWVKLNQETENYKTLEFTHDRLPKVGSFNFLSVNKNVFIGFPKVYLFNKKLGLKEVFLGMIEFYNNNRQWERLAQNHTINGRKRFRFKDKNGNIVGLKYLNILPEDFSIEISTSKKLINLSSTIDFKVFFERGGVIKEIKLVDKKVIEIDPNDQDSSKTFVKIKIDFGPNNYIDLVLPNPNLSEVFVDGQGKVINRNAYAISNIYGLSITLNNFLGVMEKKTYFIKLVDIHDHELSSIKIKKDIFVDPLTSKRTPLYQWTQLTKQLFSLTQNTRASVRIASKKPHHYVDIRNYDIDLEFDRNTGFISNSKYLLEDGLILSAFKLDEVFNSNELINIDFKEDLNLENIIEKLPRDGIWFIFSKADSSKSISPIVIKKGVHSKNFTNKPIQHLWEGSLLDYTSRIQEFKEFFDSLYLDFDHEVWKELYEIFKATEHLPISALDVWKGLIQSPKGMLTLLFSKYADSNLIQKVSQELSFMWHMVPIFNWKEVFTTWKSHLKKSNTFDQYFKLMLNSKLELIKNQLGLHSLVEHLNNTSQPINPAILGYLINSDINGSEGRMGLRTRHPEGITWASFSEEFIRGKFRLLPGELRELVPDGLLSWQKPVIYLPIILAYHSAVGNFLNPNEVSAEVLLGFKLNMDFDRQYFDDIYDSVQGYCYSESLNNQNS